MDRHSSKCNKTFKVIFLQAARRKLTNLEAAYFSLNDLITMCHFKLFTASFPSAIFSIIQSFFHIIFTVLSVHGASSLAGQRNRSEERKMSSLETHSSWKMIRRMKGTAKPLQKNTRMSFVFVLQVRRSQQSCDIRSM